MFRSICRRFVLLPTDCRNLSNSTNTHLQFIQIYASNTGVKPFSYSTSSSISGKQSNVENSFLVSYLINSCGLPPKRAILIGSLPSYSGLKFANPKGPDKVLSFLKNQGFTDAQISRIITRQPLMLMYKNPEKIFLPKMEFFHSIGFPKSNLLVYLSYHSNIFCLSLERQLIPAYDFIKSVVLSNEKAIYAMRRCAWILTTNHSNFLKPNIEILRNIGVPASNVALLLTNFPGTLLMKPPEFCKYVDEVREMGFNVSKSMFVIGLSVVSVKSNRSIKERCEEVYRTWGWSEDEISSAFRKFPHCMLLSQKKITQTMDFLVNKMGCRASEIAHFPGALGFNLERRIIPRCAVIRVLLSKGLVKGDWKLSTVLLPSKEDFLRKFVTKFSEQAPQLMSVYEGKMDAFNE